MVDERDAQAMTDETLRLECLKLAVALRPGYGELIAVADAFVSYVRTSREDRDPAQAEVFRVAGL